MSECRRQPTRPVVNSIRVIAVYSLENRTASPIPRFAKLGGIGLQDDTLHIFETRLPSHGWATDDLRYGVKFMPIALALRKAILQYNWRHSLGWLAYDLDSESARFDWYDKMCAPPNILILNPDNGHGHLLYGLKTPVHDYDGAQDKPLRYLAAIDIAMTEELGADPGYAKLLCKNPFNDRWEVLFPRTELYDLDELASWVDIEKYRDRRRRLPAVGYGRNCTLFETVRQWAYRQRRQQSYLSEEMFRDSVLNHAMAINAGFSPPLPHSEVRATAKSVSRWTWRNMSPKGFAQWQKVRSDIAAEKRHVKAMNLRTLIVQTAKECPTFTQADIAAMCGVTRETVNRHLSAEKGALSDMGAVTPTLSDMGAVYPSLGEKQ